MMLVTICKMFDFPAAHHNEHHEGHCSNVHGHTWTLEVICRGKVIEDAMSPHFGMLIDFADIKEVYTKYVEPFVEHRNLNESLNIPESTTEYIARWIYDRMAPYLPTLKTIRLWEGKSSYAEYTNGDQLA